MRDLHISIGRSALIALCLALPTFAFPLQSAAPASPPSEAEQLRDELRKLKTDYEKRIQTLEERLQKMETAQAAAAATNTASVTERISTNATVRARQFAEKEFERHTESRDQALLSESHPFAERVEQVLQDFVDIHGYFRAGYGRDDQGGPQPAFQAPGAFSKYRLGNEAENYGELTFGKNFYVPGQFKLGTDTLATDTPPGPVARVQTTDRHLQSLPGSAFRQRNRLRSAGSLGLHRQRGRRAASMKFWAGSRYYRRHDIHINDFFFYNMSGTGGGVEDIQLPFGKLAFAWIGAASSSGFSDLPEPDANNEAGFSKGNWDLRLYDVPVPLGKGEFGLVYARADSGKDATGNSAPEFRRRGLHLPAHPGEDDQCRWRQQVLAPVRHRRGENLHLRL